MATRPVRFSGLLALALGVLAFACIAPRAVAYVYWTSGTDGATVGRANLDGSGKNGKFISAGHPTFGIAVDGAHIYWPTAGGNVGRANLDGTGADQRFIEDVNPYGLAVDASHIYWPRFNTSIGRANLDGTGADVNFIAGDEELGTENMQPAEVAVAGPYVYWLDLDGGIGRANLDGSGVVLRFVRTGALSSTVLAVDGAHIYWNDEFKNTIGRANLDGSGVTPRFITGARGTVGLATDSAHIYWSSGDSIGRANLDGTGVNHKFISGVRARGLAVDALGPQPGPTPPAPEPEPAAGKRGLKGVISLNFRGGRAKGYRVSLQGTVGSRAGGSDTIRVKLSKAKGNRLYQSHEWTVALDRRDVTLDRNKASIVVNRPLGPDASGGLLAFTIRGRPKRATFACHRRANRVTGTLKGTIRINVGDEYFKTITVTKLRGTATGTQTAPRGCRPPPCLAHAWLTALTHEPSAVRLGVSANTWRVNGRRYSSLALGVHEPTTGTPFESVAHTLVVSTGKRLFSATPTLSRATVRAPGGAMSGTLRLEPTAKLKRRRFSNCRNGIASRPARVASGALTAIYDSIGTRVFDTNLNSGYTVPPMLNRTS